MDEGIDPEGGVIARVEVGWAGCRCIGVVVCVVVGEIGCKIA